MERSKLISGLLAVLCAGPATAQLTAPVPSPLLGMRNLALSPDGKQIAFAYRGDIWVVSSGGGRANQITNHVELEDFPVWSPDGKWIAYNSNRYGNSDIFISPAEGGKSQRLTYAAYGETPASWSPDGKTILFAGFRDEEFQGIVGIDVKSTHFRTYFLDMMGLQTPRWMPDGKRILYTRQGFPWWRPRYQGSKAQQLWVFDTATNQRKMLRNNGYQHLWPTVGYAKDLVLCVTVSETTPSSSPLGQSIGRNTDNANRTPNVYAVDGNGGARRVTEFVGDGVKFLTASEGLAAFTYGGKIFTMKPGDKPQKIEVTASVDDKTTNDERIVLTSGLSDAALSPKGDKLALTVRGEIWTVPTKKEKGPNADDATQMTTWEGTDSSPVWTPDGKGFFFTSDRDGAIRLYRMNAETKAVTPITKEDQDVLELHLTPDKQKLSFWMSGKGGGLYTVPVDGGTATKVFDYPMQFRFEFPTDYSWSPDMAYVAYHKANPNGYSNIFIREIRTGKEINVSRLNRSHFNPVWSSDGKYLYFGSDRDGAGIYIVPLQEEPKRPNELEMKFEKPSGTPTVKLDMDELEFRVRKFVSIGAQGNFVSDPNNGDLYFLAEGDIWKCNYAGEDARRITQGGGIGGFDISEDASQLLFLRGGMANVLNLRSPNFSAQTVTFRADWTRDINKERHAAFMQLWREYNRGFYDSNFHGRDWLEIRNRYEPLLESVGHRNEMAFLLNMMIHELEGSHSEIGPAAGNPATQSTPSLGFSFDTTYMGPGIKVGDVIPRTPASFAATKINSGEYILEINGKDVSANEALYRDVLNEQVGRELTFLVNSTPNKAGARTVKFRGMSNGELDGILYRNQIEWRRKYIEEKSGGKIGYIHIAGMGQGNLDRFNAEVWEFSQGKKAMIIDVRNNGGGNISDRIIDQLERVPYYRSQLRDGVPQAQPDNAWDMPTVVMHAESSLSNAEMYPYSMKQRGIAILVGMPTPGYCIGTWGMQLVDGTTARMPSWGVYRLDGKPMENNGVVPDYKVDISPDEWFNKKDPQLDKAIEVLLGKIR